MGHDINKAADGIEPLLFGGPSEAGYYPIVSVDRCNAV
jgi:hypothetical protein